jgi:hypothetical protein
MPAQVIEAAADPDEWFARFYDARRIGVLEADLRAELREWQPLVDQTLAAFRRDEHPLVLVSGLAILDDVIVRAEPRPTMKVALHVDEASWGNAHRLVLSSSLQTAAARLRPAGNGNHWTVEGRDAPSGWTREDALKVLHMLGTAAALLPRRLERAVHSLDSVVTMVDADIASVFASSMPEVTSRHAPANVTLAPIPGDVEPTP